MNRFLMITVASMGLVFRAQATISIAIDAEALKDGFGTRITEGTGLVLLIADTSNNGFDVAGARFTVGLPLATGAFLIGDDQIVAKSSVSSGGFGAGDFEVFLANLSMSGTWGTGDPLALYWDPYLTTSSTFTLPGTTRFGVFTNLVSLGASNWVTPADGSTVSINFLTSDATDLHIGGPYPAELGNAYMLPEPSTGLVAATGLICLVVVIRCRRRV